MSGGAEDFALVARLSDEIHAQRVEERTDPYAASPFGWIRQEASATRGSIAALMVRRWAEEVGLPTADRTNSDHDLRINGLKIEVKLSTLWSGTSFKFQQIRDQDYDHVCMLGVEPQAARLWVVHKNVALERGVSQHARGADTRWIGFKADSPPEWLSAYGGDLTTARALLEEAGRRLVG